MGSFMGEDPETLLRADVYTPPQLPFPVDDLFDELEASPPPLGEEARQLFLLDPDFTFLNHGAFGAAAAAPFHVAQRWRLYCERQPLRFMDRLLFAHLVAATREAAALIHANATDVVLCSNCTAALSAIFATAAPLAPGDAAFVLSVGYGSVKSMLRAACLSSGAELVEAPLRFPLRSDGELLAAVEASLPANTRVAVFDAVTSNTALVLPVAELAALCRRRCPGCVVVCDAAHALGSPGLQLDVPALGVDFWVSNAHKHLCGPRGCAVLWAAPESRSTLRPPVHSHGAGRGFLSDWIWDGNRDYSPLLSLPSTLRWWRAIGADRVVDHMRRTLREGVALLLARWRTHTLVPLHMCGCMALVRLPADACDVGPKPPAPEGAADVAALAAVDPPAEDGNATSADAKAWQEALYTRSVEAPCKVVQGFVYVRVSVHAYSCSADFRRLADTVCGLLEWP